MSTDAMPPPTLAGERQAPLLRPTFVRITELVARSLSIDPEVLLESFQPASERHLEGVVALRRAVFGEAASADDARYLAWRYHFGSERRGRGDCWVLVCAGRVVGMVGSERIVLREGEHETPAWSTMDIAVHPDHEGAGLGGWMNLRICAIAGTALTIGSNEKSRSMISRTFHRLPDRRSYVYQLRFRRPLEKRIGSPALAIGVALAADLAARALSRLTFPGARRTLRLRPIGRFDASVLPLLERARRPQERWIVRTPEFLNWRLFDNPRVRYAVTGAYESGELVGFLATQLREPAGGPRSLVLVDWLVDAGRFEPTFRTLCGHAVREARQQGVEAVSVTAYHGPSESCLRRWGFVQRLNPFETLAIASADASTEAWLRAPAEWFVTEANTDRDAL